MAFLCAGVVPYIILCPPHLITKAKEWPFKGMKCWVRKLYSFVPGNFDPGFLFDLAKKLKDKNSSTKLKVLGNLVKINAENEANKSKNEGQLD